MNNITYYRLRKLASNSSYTKTGELTAGVLGSGLITPVTTAAGAIVGGAGSAVITDLVMRLRKKKAAERLVMDAIAAKAGSVVGGGVGGLYGLYAGQRFGRDIYNQLTNKPM